MNTSAPQQIVVLGGGYVGVAAAIRLGRRTRRGSAHITLVNPTDHFTERLRTHMIAAGHTLVDVRITDLLRTSGVTFVQGFATRIDAGRREIHLAGNATPLPYDTLVYAVGSVPDTAAVPGADEFAHTLRSADDARRLADELPGIAARHGTVVVGGSGLTGVEAATEIAEAHPDLRVVLVGGDEPGAHMGPKARAYLRGAFDRLGVEVRAGVRVAKVTADAVLLEDGTAVAADACLWTAGVRVPPLAADAGISVDATGRVLTDNTLRSVSHPSVYAVGDAAAVRQTYGVMHGTCQGGIPTGLHAADQIARRLRGRPARPFRFGYIHQPVSLGRRDAVIQFTHADDTPARWYLTGRAAVRYKETVSSSPLPLFRLSRRWTLPLAMLARKGGRANPAVA